MSAQPATPPARSASDRPALREILKELRPRQWTKNLLVFAAFFFALGDKDQLVGLRDFPPTLAAALLFCMLSSGIYVLNDIFDAGFDRAHPVKRFRPIAAGTIGVPFARGMAFVLLGAGLLLSLLLSKGFFFVAAAYVLVQLAYTVWLKHAHLADVFVISGGFVLRAVAGAVVCGARISPWLLICAFLMALFLALCKRRHEVKNSPAAGASRPNLVYADERLLDQLIAVMAAAVIVSYSIYTQWPETTAKFGTHMLGLTIPFVVFGVFRYMDLVYRHDLGDQPEAILLTDVPLLADLALYGLSVLAVILV